MRDHLDPTERHQADREDQLLAELFSQHLDDPHTAQAGARAHSPAMGRRLAAVIAVYDAHTTRRASFDAEDAS